MATPLTDSINALTAYANEVTGGSDTNLSDAVHTLASGYGGGLSTFKTKNVVVPYEIFQNAETMLNWLITVVPQSTYALVVRDESFENMPRGGGALIVANFNNNVQGAYMRYYQHNVAAGSSWASIYYLSADEGDKYVIFYQE